MGKLKAAFLIGAGTLFLVIPLTALADTYSYDALGRLVGVTFSDGSSITYAYDAAGNRITVTQTAAP